MALWRVQTPAPFSSRSRHWSLSFPPSEPRGGKLPSGASHRPAPGGGGGVGMCPPHWFFLHPCPVPPNQPFSKCSSVTSVRVCQASPAKAMTGKMKTKSITLQFHSWTLHTICAQQFPCNFSKSYRGSKGGKCNQHFPKSFTILLTLRDQNSSA